LFRIVIVHKKSSITWWKKKVIKSSPHIIIKLSTFFGPGNMDKLKLFTKLSTVSTEKWITKFGKKRLHKIDFYYRKITKRRRKKYK